MLLLYFVFVLFCCCELLIQIGVLLFVFVIVIDEFFLLNEVFVVYVECLVCGKVVVGLVMLEGCGEDGYVLGVDILVVIDG